MKSFTHRLVLISAFTATALAAGGCATPEEKRDKFMARGDAFVAAEKYTEATIEYRKALQQDPLYSRGYAKLGEAFTAADDVRSALSAFVRASDLAPDDIQVNLRAGNLLLVARRFQDAKTRARNILTKDPENIPGLVLLGNSLAGLQSMDEAVDVAKRAAALSKDNKAGLLGNLGVFELARGNVDDAERTFLKAVELAPKTLSPLLSLANLYHTIGRLKDAERVLRDALALAPKDPTANATLAAVLMQSGRPAAAEPYLKVASEEVGTVEASLTLANYYVSVGRTGEALALLQKLSTTEEGFAEARIRTAIIDYAYGRREDAHRRLREILERDPKDATALALEAQLLLAENRFEDAKKVVNAALVADPRSASAHFALGKIQLAMGGTEDARKSFVEVVNHDPGHVDAQIHLSRLHLNRREIDTAISYAEQAVRNDQDNIEARLALVRALVIRPEDFSKADSQLAILLGRYPNSPDVYSSLGIVALQKEKKDLARRMFEKALQIDPDHIDALSGLSAMDADAGRLNAARQRIEQRLAKAKNPPASLLMLAAKVYVTTGEFDRTEQMLRRIVENDPTNLEGYNLLAQFYVARRKLPEAMREYEALVAKEPKSPTAQTALGLLAQALGDLEKARVAYEAAVQANPRAAAAANNLAWIYANSEHGDLDGALQLAQSARAQMPTSPDVAATLGFVYYRKNMGAFAVPLLEDAITTQPKNPRFHYYLGLVWAQAGEDAKARRSLEAALKLNPQFDQAEHARRVIATLIY